MITLHLTRAGEAEGVYLKLPASKTEIGEAFAEPSAISTDTSTTKITEVISNVYNLNGYLKNIDVEKPGALDKIGELGRRLQTMDRNECLKFEGVLDANSVNGIDDVLRLSQTLDEYAVLPDVGSDSTLGKYLVEHGFGDFPKKVKPYLDHHIIGDEFYADHGGAFCRSGYVIRKDQLPEQLLEQEPEDNEKWLMLLKLRVKDNVRKATDLVLPATEASLDSAKKRLGIDEFAEADTLTARPIYTRYSLKDAKKWLQATGFIQ